SEQPGSARSVRRSYWLRVCDCRWTCSSTCEWLPRGYSFGLSCVRHVRRRHGRDRWQLLGLRCCAGGSGARCGSKTLEGRPAHESYSNGAAEGSGASQPRRASREGAAEFWRSARTTPNVDSSSRVENERRCDRPGLRVLGDGSRARREPGHSYRVGG